MQTGTEEEVRAFVADHFTELPEAMQKELAVELFKEALDEEIATRKAIIAEKDEAIKLIEALEKADEEMKNAGA